MAALPECPKCRGPSVPECWHPDASEGESIGSLADNRRSSIYGEKLRCLACGHRHQAKSLEAALNALEAADEILREADGRFLRVDALARMGEAWRKRIAEERAKYERAMRGEW